MRCHRASVASCGGGSDRDQPTGSAELGEPLEKVTAGESGRASDEDDRVSHALWLAAEQAEVGERSKARQHERKVQPSIARDRRADGWQEVDDLEVSPDAAALRHVRVPPTLWL